MGTCIFIVGMISHLLSLEFIDDENYTADFYFFLTIQVMSACLTLPFLRREERWGYVYLLDQLRRL